MGGDPPNYPNPHRGTTGTTALETDRRLPRLPLLILHPNPLMVPNLALDPISLMSGSPLGTSWMDGATV